MKLDDKNSKPKVSIFLPINDIFGTPKSTTIKHQFKRIF